MSIRCQDPRGYSHQHQQHRPQFVPVLCHLSCEPAIACPGCSSNHFEVPTKVPTTHMCVDDCTIPEPHHFWIIMLCPTRAPRHEKRGTCCTMSLRETYHSAGIGVSRSLKPSLIRWFWQVDVMDLQFANWDSRDSRSYLVVFLTALNFSRACVQGLFYKTRIQFECRYPRCDKFDIEIAFFSSLSDNDRSTANHFPIRRACIDLHSAL